MGSGPESLRRAAGMRDRKRDPYRCVGCGATFEACYFDDRKDDTRDSSHVEVEARCPRCGKAKSLSLPAGAERTLVIEAGTAPADEGGGG